MYLGVQFYSATSVHFHSAIDKVGWWELIDKEHNDDQKRVCCNLSSECPEKLFKQVAPSNPLFLDIFGERSL